MQRLQTAGIGDGNTKLATDRVNMQEQRKHEDQGIPHYLEKRRYLTRADKVLLVAAFLLVLPAATIGLPFLAILLGVIGLIAIFRGLHSLTKHGEPEGGRGIRATKLLSDPSVIADSTPPRRPPI